MSPVADHVTKVRIRRRQHWFDDPVKFVQWFWPDIYLTKYQKEIMYSVRDNVETVVPAGNQLGKDFVAGLIALWWFYSRKPARVVTTGPTEQQLLDILWGEINRFILAADKPLPFKVQAESIYQLARDGITRVPGSEMVAIVSKKEGLLGRHATDGFKAYKDGYADIPRTLLIIDEASGVHENVYQLSKTWAKRRLIIGNCFPCNNFFKHAIDGKPGTDDRGGDIPRPNGAPGFFRKVIKVTVEDSPNIQYARAQQEAGLSPDNKVLVPGVKTWAELEENLATWDEKLKSIGLRAEFYKGEGVFLYPEKNLETAQKLSITYRSPARRIKWLGIDAAMGGDNTAFAGIDEKGLVKLQSLKTPDTNIIVTIAIDLIKKHGIQPENVLFDMGGGGYQIACMLRKMGYNVRTVAFGESVKPDLRRGITIFDQKKINREVQYVYKNRRAEMYGMLSILIDPFHQRNWGIDFDGNSDMSDGERKSRGELRRQMSLIPLDYNEGDGRLYIPPKDKRTAEKEGDTNPTLKQLLGCSPDELDALVLAVFGMEHKEMKATAGIGY